MPVAGRNQRAARNKLIAIFGFLDGKCGHLLQALREAPGIARWHMLRDQDGEGQVTKADEHALDGCDATGRSTDGDHAIGQKLSGSGSGLHGGSEPRCDTRQRLASPCGNAERPQKRLPEGLDGNIDAVRLLDEGDSACG